MALLINAGLMMIYLSRSIDLAQAAWEYPPFFAPNLNDSALRSFRFDADTARANIALEEEADHEVCIAVLNYKDDTSPTIGPLSDGKSNDVLGAELRQDKITRVWSLWIKNPQDYETRLMQEYRFSIYLGKNVYSIAIFIVDIDDNPPTVRALQKNCKIKENYSGLSNCTYLVKDLDGHMDKATFHLSSVPSEGNHFQLVTSGGEDPEHELIARINVIESLDFEAVRMYKVVIQARDAAGNTDSLETIVEVTDVADMPPSWTRITATENVVEKSTKTFQVLAIDGDIEIKAEINYQIEIVDDRDADYFSVDKETGLITINEIDRDERNQEMFRFVVTAYEKPEPESKISSTIVVIVEDVNDHSPIIKPDVDVLSVEIDEGKYTTLEFDSPIEISDPDLAENGQFSVSLTDDSRHDWSSAFVVVPTRGYQSGIFTISVVNASRLDYEDENWKTIDIQLRAVEAKNSSHIGTRDIHIELKNLNDELPMFDEGTPSDVSIREDVKEFFPIATVHATDRDYGDNVTHSLIAQRALSINAITGEIITNRPDALDYETMSVVSVQIVATDLAQHKTYTTLTINVIDVNDVPPNLYLPKESPTVKENELTEVRVSINATDKDTNAELTFSIDWANTRAQKNSVSVNESHYRDHLEILTAWPDEDSSKRYAEGKLIVTREIDYEAFDVIFLSISVTDEKTELNSETTSASLTLYIIDVNDNDPIFAPIEAMDVTENQISDALISTVTATDADGPEFSKISYFLEPINGTKNDLVVINKVTGVIRVGLSKAIDAEDSEYLYYNVIASDGERNTSNSIEIYVNDQNDVVPRLLNDDYKTIFRIPEKSSNGTPIFTVEAIDGDRTSPFNNVSYLMNAKYSSPMQYFSIGRFDGLIQVNLADEHILDRDFGESSFTLNLKIRDNYLVDDITSNSNAIDLTVRVILEDINDQDPILPDLGEIAKKVTENTNKGELVLTVEAHDSDEPNTNNSKVFYELKSVSSAENNDIVIDEKCTNLFYVITRDDKIADIYANCDLRGYYGRWNLELYVQDLGTKPSSRNSTANYVIRVTDFNYNKPEITFPTGETKLPLDKNPTLHTQLRTYDNQLLRDFRATDKDHGDSGIVNFALTSPTGEHENFEIVPIETNVARLRLAKKIDVEAKNSYTLTLVVTDGGNPPLNESRTFGIIFITKSGPKFDERESIFWFKENQTGLDAWSEIPKARDMVSEVEENPVDIYYFLMPNEIDGEYFALDKKNRNLTVKKELDREKQEVMIIHVIAATDAEAPPGNPMEDAVLKITIVVVDENDNAPKFERNIYRAGIAIKDALDEAVLTVKATDVDLNDTLTYSIKPNSTNTSHSSLDAITEPFSLNPTNGELLPTFTVTSNMRGFFKFHVIVRDKMDHEDETTVQIHIVPESSRVVFTFDNLASDVRKESTFVIDAFSDAFGYFCNIDDIQSTLDENNRVIDNSTTVTTHFIDSEDNLPIGPDAIILLSSDLKTIEDLKVTLRTRSLVLRAVPTAASSSTADVGQIIHWILVSLTIVFFLCNMTLLAAYIYRTRSLSQRLEKLAITKYGSQESGLDRAGVVPTTNQFAVAGSNPIWNTQEKSIDDNFSQGSGDSDLIGIEDNPDFGYVNDAIVAGENWGNPKGGIVNPKFATLEGTSGTPVDRISHSNKEKSFHDLY